MLFRSKTFIFILFIFNFNEMVSGEVYSAVADMEDVLYVEEVHIKSLESFVKYQQQLIDIMKIKIKEYKMKHDEAKADITAYVSNPVNAFLLTKRLTYDWKEIELKMLSSIGEDVLDRLNLYTEDEAIKMPDDDDLSGAATALIRLQKLYFMNATSIADGHLNGVKYNTTKMTASDCFYMGMEVYISGETMYAIMWLNEALKRLDVNTDEANLEANIKAYLSHVHYEKGNLTEALQITNEMIEKDPTSALALDNKEAIESKMDDEGENEEEDTHETSDPHEVAMNVVLEYDQVQYGRLCRNELQPLPAKLAPLRCRSVTNGVPFLKIGPLKLEEHSLEPYIVSYYDVIYDSEIKYLKETSKPNFQRAAIKNATSNELVVLSVRTSKAAFIDEKHPFAHKINQRTIDMTKLNLHNSELLQVVNYGIGGHYDPHFDFFELDDTSEYMRVYGNRIATVLFYMSDVEQGGSTVFPFLELAIVPKKGSAVFWHNLYPSGDSDYRTRHGACPVLVGSKWVANKWIRSNDQMFKRPCDLKHHTDNNIFIPGMGFFNLE